MNFLASLSSVLCYCPSFFRISFFRFQLNVSKLTMHYSFDSVRARCWLGPLCIWLRMHILKCALKKCRCNTKQISNAIRWDMISQWRDDFELIRHATMLLGYCTCRRNECFMANSRVSFLFLSNWHTCIAVRGLIYEHMIWPIRRENNSYEYISVHSIL